MLQAFHENKATQWTLFHKYFQNLDRCFMGEGKLGCEKPQQFSKCTTKFKPNPPIDLDWDKILKTAKIALC